LHLALRRRDGATQCFRRIGSLQKLAAVHASVLKHFDQERGLFSLDIFKTNRASALAEWRYFGTV
jgi:putative transposase